jgi:hypothetical protein
MEDILLELLGIILEAILQIVGEWLLVLLGKGIASVFKSIQCAFADFFDLHPIAIGIGLVILGAGSGFLSVVAFPHPLVHPSRAPGLSVILSPLITGIVMSQAGRILRSKGRKTTRIESFSYGYVFALAMSIVRFVMLHP